MKLEAAPFRTRWFAVVPKWLMGLDTYKHRNHDKGMTVL